MTGSRRALRDVVAEEVRGHMGRQRLSIHRLGQATGLSERYLSRRLSARLSLNLDDLDAIADALGVSPMQLFPAELIRTRDVPLPRRLDTPRPPGRPRQGN